MTSNDNEMAANTWPWFTERSDMMASIVPKKYGIVIVI